MFDVIVVWVEDVWVCGVCIVVGGWLYVFGGWFYELIVIVDVVFGMCVVDEENFVLILVVSVFDMFDEVVEMVNDIEYGFVVYVCVICIDMIF